MSSIDTPQKATVLVIDDEVGLLGLIRMALEREGYQVHTASTAQEAIEYYRENCQKVGMVLLDFLIPPMSGELVFDSLRSLNPDVRVVLLTVCEESVVERMFRKGLWGYLQKPFDLQTLAQKVHEAIRGPTMNSAATPASAHSR